ncbi:MAG: hypothetical protein QGF94_03970 [Candidatus Thalassarchaeaceae archaeon]|nr:hypothetical protein [Candidatus Thalassarchaeaceae archaeon]
MIRRAILLSLLIILTSCLSIELVEAQTQARSCSANPPSGTNIARIEITPSGPLSMPADAAINLTAVAYDNQDNIVNVQIAWTATSGNMQNFGGGSARWSPQTMGSQTATACSGNVAAQLFVNVLPGAPLSLELSVASDNITADDSVELTPLLLDQFGNTWVPNIPFANWTLPDDTSINLPNDGTSPTFTPGPIGLMLVEIAWGDWTASTSFNVTAGTAVSLIIEHESSTVSSDDMLDLCSHLVDQRGNGWSVSSTWSTFEGLADASLSSTEGECIVFDAGTVGEWTVLASASNGMSTGLAITTTEGRLAQIELDDLPTEMNIGDSYPLDAIGYDAAGNTVAVDGWNWSVTTGPSQDSIDYSGGIAYFDPNMAGQHTIQVMAAGRVQAIDVEVFPGVPIYLEIEILDDASSQVVTGFEIDLIVYGVDVNGNRNPVIVENENWTIQNGYGSIEEDPIGGPGHYTYTAGGIGFVGIYGLIENADGSIIVEVLVGELDHLEVIIQNEGSQGKSVHFDLKGYDISGNEVTIHPCAATITTDIGKSTCDDDGWTLELEESGEQVVHARIGSAEGSDFIDVEDTWFGWGDNNQIIIVSSLLIVAIISAVLVLLFMHLGNRIEEEMEAIEQESDDNDEPTTPVTSMDLISGLPPLAFTSPPPPMPQPSATIPQPSPAIPATQTVHSPVVMPPPAMNEVGGPTLTTPSNPFATLDSSPVQAPVIQEVDAEPEYDPELPGSKAPEPVQEVPQDDSVLDDTWGEMTGDWGEQGDTLSDAAATTAEIRHENRRGDGPSDAVGATLRPLPGTEIGTDGWYFDPDGRPTHWIHSEESGWSQE